MDTQEGTNPTQETPIVEGTEAEEPKTVTYTQEQVSKMQGTFETKQRQAERKAGAAEEQYNQTLGQMTSLQEQIGRIQAERDTAEMAGLEDQPEAQRLLGFRQQLRKQEAELQKQQAKFAETQREAMEGFRSRDAAVLSKEYGIAIDELLECGSYPEMVIKAKDTVIARLKGEKESKPKAEPVVPAHVDSGLQTGSGAGRVWKVSEIQNMTSKEKFDNRSEILKASTEGRIRNE